MRTANIKNNMNGCMKQNYAEEFFKTNFHNPVIEKIETL